MKVKLMITESACRGGLHKKGETFVIKDKCPPICTELWHNAYPYIFALQNGATLDTGDIKTSTFTVKCPDGGRVVVIGEAIKD